MVLLLLQCWPLVTCISGVLQLSLYRNFICSCTTVNCCPKSSLCKVLANLKLNLPIKEHKVNSKTWPMLD